MSHVHFLECLDFLVIFKHCDKMSCFKIPWIIKDKSFHFFLLSLLLRLSKESNTVAKGEFSHCRLKPRNMRVP